MSAVKLAVFAIFSVFLTACALTPEQQAARTAAQKRQEQALHVQLAKQCDADTAELIYQHYNPPLSRSEKEAAAFNQRYAEKVNAPMFQACYKLALENHLAQEKLRQIRAYDYWDDDFGHRHYGRMIFCHACWW